MAIKPMTGSQLRARTAALIEEEALVLTEQSETGLRRRRMQQGRNSYIFDASKYGPEVLWLAACELVAAGWVVHYGPCKSGRKYELPFTAFHVMTQADYVRRARGELQFEARTVPYLWAFMATVVTLTLAALSTHAHNFWWLALGVALSAAYFGVAKLVRNARVRRLPKTLMTVSVPFKPITRRVAWTTWLRDQH